MKVICTKGHPKECEGCDHFKQHEPHIEPGFTCTVWRGCSVDDNAICAPIKDEENE